MAYAWLTYATARQQLAARLADPGQAKWTDAEAGLYIQESLRMWNCLTNAWMQDFVFTPTTRWTDLGGLAGSPRLQTVTDSQAYTLMEYHLQEPPTGGTWTGTSQFTITDLSGALGRRRDEVVQMTNANDAILTIQPITNNRRTVFPDTVLEPQRIRFLPAISPVLPPVTLVRDDRMAMELYLPEFYQEAPGLPAAWMVSAEPPLSFDVDVPASVEGVYEVLALVSGPVLAPPAATLLGIPDDFCWVVRFGALADLLGRESEATDRQRAMWCEQHYQDGLKVLMNTPWVVLANLNGQSVDVTSFTDMDRYQPEWDTNATAQSVPAVVIGGLDFLWAPPGVSVGLTLLASAPVPKADTDFLQVSRSAWDAVLSMAQVLATFKIGGEEFQSTMNLEKIFVQAAAAENDRLQRLGVFADWMEQRATEENRRQERYGQS